MNDDHTGAHLAYDHPVDTPPRCSACGRLAALCPHWPHITTTEDV